MQVPTILSSTSIKAYMQRSGSGTRNTLPASCMQLSYLKELLKLAYRAFTAAKFDEVQKHCRQILLCIPLLIVDSREEVQRTKELLNISREYLTAVAIRAATTVITLESNAKRHVELNAYFTHCQLQPAHVLLTLKIAMTSAFKSKNYIAAASFCRRLLELPEIASEKQLKLRTTAKKVLQKSEKEARNEHPLDYDDSNLTVLLCAKSLTPIRNENDAVRCPYCAAAYSSDMKGQLCVVCHLSRVGEQTLGLVSFLSYPSPFSMSIIGISETEE